MSEGVGQKQVATDPTDKSPARQRWLPFWLMQVTEVAVALVFAYLSVHVAHGALLVISAIPLLALAVTAQGPLGVFRICGQRLNLVLVMTVSVAIALAPIVPSLRPDIQGIIVLEFGAVGLFRVATLTRTGDIRRAVRPGPHGGSSVINTTATVVAPDGGAGAGAAAAGAGPPPGPGPSGQSDPSTSGGAARWAGRTGGAAVASGKRLAADYGPEAEKQAKRVIRGFGKWAGRLSSPPAPPEDTGS